jgi:hypothetical protein
MMSTGRGRGGAGENGGGDEVIGLERRRERPCPGGPVCRGEVRGWVGGWGERGKTGAEGAERANAEG